jgi:hypothetical protein
MHKKKPGGVSPPGFIHLAVGLRERQLMLQYRAIRSE